MPTPQLPTERAIERPVDRSRIDQLTIVVNNPSGGPEVKLVEAVADYSHRGISALAVSVVDGELRIFGEFPKEGMFVRRPLTSFAHGAWRAYDIDAYTDEVADDA